MIPINSERVLTCQCYWFYQCYQWETNSSIGLPLGTLVKSIQKCLITNNLLQHLLYNSIVSSRICTYLCIICIPQIISCLIYASKGQINFVTRIHYYYEITISQYSMDDFKMHFRLTRETLQSTYARLIQCDVYTKVQAHNQTWRKNFSCFFGILVT